MNLKKKKKLASRVLRVGIDRIVLVSPEEIKDAITRQDIIDLKKSGMIKIKSIRGKKKKVKRKTRRKVGSRKIKVKTRKKDYLRLTRKLRNYVKNLRRRGKINREDYYALRKKIRAKEFRDLSHLIGAVRKEK